MSGLLVLLLIALAVLIVLLAGALVRGVTNPPRHTDAFALAHGLAMDPGDAGLSYEAWTIHRPDGARLPVWEVDLQRASGLTVVMVHGWGQSRIDMLARSELYQACEHVSRIVMYDLRGHGEASGGGDRATLGSRDDDDLQALIEALGDDSKVLLVGHSLGAQIALRTVARTAEGVAGRIIGIIAMGVFDDFHRSMRNRLRARGYPTRPMTDMAMLWLRLTGRQAPSVLAVAEQIRVPVLLLHGSDDDTAPIDEAQQLAERLPNAEMAELAGARHLDGYEHAPDECAEAVRAFVRRVARDQSTQR